MEVTAFVRQVKAGTAQPERLSRIAEEAGSSVEEVGNFVTEFNVLRSAAKKFAAGENPGAQLLLPHSDARGCSMAARDRSTIVVLRQHPMSSKHVSQPCLEVGAHAVVLQE